MNNEQWTVDSGKNLREKTKSNSEQRERSNSEHRERSNSECNERSNSELRERSCEQSEHLHHRLKIPTLHIKIQQPK